MRCGRRETVLKPLQKVIFLQQRTHYSGGLIVFTQYLCLGQELGREEVHYYPTFFFFSSSAILNLFLAVTVAVASIQRTVLAQKYIISCLNEFWEDMQLKIIHQNGGSMKVMIFVFSELYPPVPRKNLAHNRCIGNLLNKLMNE